MPNRVKISIGVLIKNSTSVFGSFLAGVTTFATFVFVLFLGLNASASSICAAEFTPPNFSRLEFAQAVELEVNGENKNLHFVGARNDRLLFWSFKENRAYSIDFPKNVVAQSLPKFDGQLGDTCFPQALYNALKILDERGKITNQNISSWLKHQEGVPFLNRLIDLMSASETTMRSQQFLATNQGRSTLWKFWNAPSGQTANRKRFLNVNKIPFLDALDFSEFLKQIRLGQMGQLDLSVEISQQVVLRADGSEITENATIPVDSFTNRNSLGHSVLVVGSFKEKRTWRNLFPQEVLVVLDSAYQTVSVWRTQDVKAAFRSGVIFLNSN